MKKKTLRLIAACALIFAAGIVAAPCAYADSFGGKDWNVTFTSNKKMNSDFSGQPIADIMSEMQPGDDATFNVRLTNSYSGDTDWYMNNKVLQSLEDTKGEDASKGGYKYALTFTDSSGKEQIIYNSDNVGGEAFKPKHEGLHEATSALEDFFYLTTLPRGKSGTVTLKVLLDGESQGNAYMNTQADLALNFAVELPAENDKVVTSERENVVTKVRDFFKTGFVKTSDDSSNLFFFIAAGIIGVLLIVIGIICIRLRKKMKKGDKK